MNLQWALKTWVFASSGRLRRKTSPRSKSSSAEKESTGLPSTPARKCRRMEGHVSQSVKGARTRTGSARANTNLVAKVFQPMRTAGNATLVRKEAETSELP